MKRIYIFSIILLTTISSCKKDEQVVNTTAARLTITSPAEGSTFAPNQTVHIQATATALENIHGYLISIHPVNDTTPVFRYSNHLHQKDCEIDTSWVNTSPAIKNQVIEITVALDHAGNTMKEKRNIICN